MKDFIYHLSKALAEYDHQQRSRAIKRGLAYRKRQQKLNKNN